MVPVPVGAAEVVVLEAEVSDEDVDKAVVALEAEVEVDAAPSRH